MAIIHVTKDLRINGTQRAWQVEQAKAVHGRLRWEPTNWFATLPAAIQFLVERDIRAAPIEGVAEVIEYAKRVADQYADKVARHFEHQERDHEDGELAERVRGLERQVEEIHQILRKIGQRLERDE